MKTKYMKEYGVMCYSFESITDLVKYIKEHESLHLEYKCSSNKSGFEKYKFTKTYDYAEAENLLLHGWEEGTKQLKEQLNVKVPNKTQRKQFYSVQGYQPCVPRYLQGLPDAMINSKQVSVKQKVIVINKLFAYVCGVKAEQILQESAKCLRLVQSLESEGYRVELNIIASFGETSACYRYDDANINGPMFRVCLKKASQRLNLKQVAFPLIHPSMLRRILFALIERVPECKEGFVGYGYGNCVRDTHNVYKALKGQYLIPTMVQEEEIQDINKYKII